MKIARRWGYRKKKIPKDKAKLLFMANNFHGRTIAVCGGSDEDERTADFGPFPKGLDTVPFNNVAALEE